MASRGKRVARAAKAVGWVDCLQSRLILGGILWANTFVGLAEDVQKPA